jgi:hypothetical protein
MAAVFDIELHDAEVVQNDDSEDDVIEIGEVTNVILIPDICRDILIYLPIVHSFYPLRLLLLGLAIFILVLLLLIARPFKVIMSVRG